MTKRINYLFCINTGRAGSHYLSKIFSHVDYAVSTHEMHPIGHSTPMINFLKGKPKSMEALAKIRLKNITSLAMSGRAYLETNHMFIKGYGWYFAKNLPAQEIGVIILTRDKDKVVDSLCRVGGTPLNYIGRHWYFTPNIKDPICPPPRFWRLPPRLSYKLIFGMSTIAKQLNKIYNRTGIKLFKYADFFHRYNRESAAWYYDETYALGEKFKSTHPNIRYYEVNLDDLNNPEKVNQIMDYFGLSLRKTITDVIGVPSNLKSHH